MAVTQQAQYYADKSATGDAQQCCLALGGKVELDDENQQICVGAKVGTSTTSFYLADACQYTAAAGVAVENTIGGGLFNWIGSNIGGISSAITNTYAAITGQMTPQQQMAALQAQQEEERQRANRRAIVGTVVFIVVAILVFYFFKNRKK